MAVQSWHDKPQDIEIDQGMARKGAPKKLDPLVIHDDHAMRARLRTPSIGAPPTGGAPPDASSPLPTDPEKQHGSKRLPIPALHPSMASERRSGPEGSIGAKYDPASANRVVGQAILSGSTRLPDSTSEET